MKPQVEKLTKKKQTQATKDSVNYLWRNHVMYSDDPDIKVTSRSYDTQKCQKAKCNIGEAIQLLYTDGKGRSTGEYITTLGKHDISIQKVGKSNYLSDNGALFKFLSKKGVTKRKYLELLKAVNTDYDLTLMNEELCIELDDPDDLADCYRNLVNVIAKIKCIAN